MLYGNTRSPLGYGTFSFISRNSLIGTCLLEHITIRMLCFYGFISVEREALRIMNQLWVRQKSVIKHEKFTLSGATQITRFSARAWQNTLGSTNSQRHFHTTPWKGAAKTTAPTPTYSWPFLLNRHTRELQSITIISCPCQNP